MALFKTLENERVRLSLLDLSHVEKLISIASEPGLLTYSPSEIHTQEHLKTYIGDAIRKYYEGTDIPYIIFDKKKDRYAGSTRFGCIDHENSVLHIGWTWIGNDFQGSGLNGHMKFLMLEFAFEELKFHKVEFRIDERNIRSRKAIEKIGAQMEGILRQNVVLSDGFRRNTCCYGILIEEWPGIKERLQKDLISQV